MDILECEDMALWYIYANESSAVQKMPKPLLGHPGGVASHHVMSELVIPALQMKTFWVNQA